MAESRRLIRLEIDGQWPAEEMGNVLRALSSLYDDLRFLLELLHEE